MSNEELRKYYGLVTNAWNLLREYLNTEPSRGALVDAFNAGRDFYRDYESVNGELAHDLSVCMLAEIRRVYKAKGVDVNVCYK